MEPQDASRLVQSLFLSWYPSLVRYACRVCGDLDVAEEAVQEAFMALYRELADGKTIHNPKGWTLVVVKREIGKQHRSQRRQRDGLERMIAEDLHTATYRTPEADPLDDLTRLFSVLSQREEEVLMLRLQAFGYEEIASQLEISRNSVKTLLARAFRKLRLAAGEGAGTAGDAAIFGLNDDVPETLQ